MSSTPASTTTTATTTVRCLSVQQPFCEAILAGVKTVELRTWATTYRGPILVHAGAQFHNPTRLPRTDAARLAEEVAFRLALRRPATDYPRGAILGLAWLHDCIRYDAASWERDRVWHRALGPHYAGTIGWSLREIRRLPIPVPYRGRLGLFTVPLANLGLEVGGWVRHKLERYAGA